MSYSKTLSLDIQLDDYSDKVLAAVNNAVERFLESAGEAAEGHAKDSLTESKAVDTGNLRDGVTHAVDGNTLYVGTNSEYGAYVEYGTGKYNGGYGWWVYVKGGDESKKGSAADKRYTYEEAKRIMAILRSKGLDAHMTEGMPARPYIKPAIADHIAEYKDLLEQSLKNA